MDSLLTAVNAVTPMFLTIAVGYAARRLGLLPDGFLTTLNRLIFTLLLPLKLFNNIYTSDFGSVFHGKLSVFIVTTTFLSYTVIYALVVFFVKEDSKRGVMIQALYRSNFVIMSLPIVASLVGESGLGTTSTIVAIVVPIGNVLAIFTLQRFSGQEHGWNTLLKKICTNPLIIGILLGLIFGLLKIRIPICVSSTINSLGAASTPMALLVLGGLFQFLDVRTEAGEIFWCVFGKLVLIPGVMLVIAIAMGFRGMDIAIILAYFASPCGPTSFIMAKQMGGNIAIAGGSVVLGCTCSSLTLIMFAYLLIQFGFM